LTLKHLHNLLPYLDRMGENELWHLAEACERLGFPECGRENLSHRLPEKWKRIYYPSKDDLIQDLNGFSTDEKGVFRVRFWLENIDKRHESKEQVIAVIDHWLSIDPTIARIRIAAACIQTIGTRDSLVIITKHEQMEPRDEIAKIIVNTRYAIQMRTLN